MRWKTDGSVLRLKQATDDILGPEIRKQRHDNKGQAGDEAVMQVSQPRQPCWNLARRWRIKTLPSEVQKDIGELADDTPHTPGRWTGA